MTSMEPHLASQHALQSATLDGAVNQGSQIVHNSGSVTNYFYAGPTHQPPTPIFHVPFRRDRDFIDRPLLAEVRQRATQPASRVGLIGLGGVGKTQLAIEYAYQCRDADPKLSVLWVHASSVTRFDESYRSIAQRLQLNGWNDPKKDVLPLVHAWLSNENNGRWTMVVDNADNVDVLFATRNRDTASQSEAIPSMSTRSISGYLPCSENGSIIITSRSREVVEGLLEYVDDIIHVDIMTVVEGLALLSRKLKPENRGAQQDELMNLARELDCMPLAITQAASYINQRAPRMSVSQYLGDLVKDDIERIALLEQSIRDPRRDEQASNSIIITWHISFEHLRQVQDSAARLLALMCLFNRESIPENLLVGRYLFRGENDEPHGSNQSEFIRQFQNDVATLRAYNLVRVGSDNQAFDMHRLVQFSTRRWLELHGELAHWQIQFASLICSVFPADAYSDTDNWPICQALLPHLESLMSYNVEDDNFSRSWLVAAHRGAWYMLAIAKYDVAEAMAHESLARRKRRHGLESVEVLDGMVLLAAVLFKESKYVEAEQLGRQALEGHKTLLGVNHPRTLLTLENLAMTLAELGQYGQAESMFRQALAQYEETLGLTQTRTMNCMDHLGIVLRRQSKYAEAEELNRRALATFEAELGVDHFITLRTMYSLASTLRSKGKYQQAEELYRRSLAGLQKQQGVNHPDILLIMDSIAIVLKDQRLLEQSEESHRKTLAMREKALGVSHQHTLLSVWGLADVRCDQQDYVESLSLYERAIAGFTQTLGPTHPCTQGSIQQRKQLLEMMDDRLKGNDASDLS